MKIARSTENGLESARCCALILMLNLVRFVKPDGDARLMYARNRIILIDLTRIYIWWSHHISFRLGWIY